MITILSVFIMLKSGQEIAYRGDFKARMIEQICYIENYRHAAKSDEDRTLTFEEAAMEWIDKYAADFPSWL